MIYTFPEKKTCPIVNFWAGGGMFSDNLTPETIFLVAE